VKRRAALVLLAACSTEPKLGVNAPAPVASVPGMVRVPAGSFVRGREGGREDEAPPHTVEVHAFYIDETLVTRRDFARFVEQTGYVTTAERIGFGMASEEGMDDWAWQRVPHASWRAPFIRRTPDAESFLRDDAPVVMVSHVDAETYCAHYGKRLPTEAEWEYAMRAGASGTRYPWGDDPERSPGRMGLNFWQGASHHENLRSDGWVYVSPVRAFPPNAFGIYDPVGNVWQWTADRYAKTTYAETAKSSPARDPRGPSTGRERVLRGGSWWCGACTCEGNGLFYRGHGDPEAPFNNNGFRCARD
jgi:formylglycine-generating enzyme required for sulfatase activity